MQTRKRAGTALGISPDRLTQLKTQVKIPRTDNRSLGTATVAGPAIAAAVARRNCCTGPARGENPWLRGHGLRGRGLLLHLQLPLLHFLQHLLRSFYSRLVRAAAGCSASAVAGSGASSSSSAASASGASVAASTPAQTGLRRRFAVLQRWPALGVSGVLATSTTRTSSVGIVRRSQQICN